MKKIFRSFAPATVANVACGFDVLGFAIDSPGDEVDAFVNGTNDVIIETISGDGGRLPVEAERNTSGVAVIALRQAIGNCPGITLRLKKGLPLGSGLGSSAASSVGALVAANAALGSPMRREELLPFAMEGERAACGVAHADNVAPCLLGGFVLIRSYSPLDVIRLPVPPALRCAVVNPAVEVRTQDARGILRRDVKLAEAIKQWGNVGGLVSGLYRNDLALIGRSLEDGIIEPERALLIPAFNQVKQAAIGAGALGCSISGSGPSIFALTEGDESCDLVAAQMVSAFTSSGIGSIAYRSQINLGGATVRELAANEIL